MIEFLQAEELARHKSIRHGFFTRLGGVSEGLFASLNCGLSSADDPICVVENRVRVAAQMEVPAENLLSCYQIHSPDVVTVTQPWLPAERPRADAMVTAERNIALGILTADCGPVLFADVATGVIGAAHAGWRGAIGGVLENTLTAMEKLGAKRNRIETALGPCIWRNSYEVSVDFPAPFLAESEDNQRFFIPTPQPDHFLFDLPAYITAKLYKLSVASVTPSLADTYADEQRFFSYRRNCHAGIQRAASLISVIMQTGES